MDDDDMILTESPIGSIQDNSNTSAVIVTPMSTPFKPNQQNQLKRKRSNLQLYFKKSFNFPAILLLAFSLPASCLYGLSFLASEVITSVSPCTNSGIENDAITSSIIFILQNLLVFVLFPVGGWISDTKIGRYRTIYISLWLFWVGLGIMTTGAVLLLIEPCNGPVYIIGKYVCHVVALVVIAIGAAGFFPNILVFIMDQMIGASSGQLRSYIHWFVWTLYLGFFFSDWMSVASQISNNQKWFIIPFFACLTSFSVILIINFFFSHVFCLVYNKENPYTTVYEIFKFASKHKFPVNRSAMTYWEEEIPSRIDLAKSKYGGPYKHETVESVKTLLNMLMLYLAMFPFFVGYSGPINQIISFIQHLKTPENSVSVTFVYLSDSIITIVALPILELIILPFFPKFEYFISKPLRWMFLATVFITMSNITLGVIDAIAHTVGKSNDTVECFIYWRISENTLNFPYQLVVIPTLLWGVCDLLITTSTFTFICSQAPHSMRGMLLGLFMLLQGVFQAIGNGISIGFGLSRETFSISCGVWYWLTLTFFSAIGCVVFALVAKRYHNRVRSDVDIHHQIIEDVYERRLQRESNTFHVSNLSMLRKLVNINSNSGNSN